MMQKHGGTWKDEYLGLQLLTMPLRNGLFRRHMSLDRVFSLIAYIL